MTRWKKADASRVDREITPFKLLDAWGRWVGYEFSVWEVRWVEVQPDESPRSWTDDPKPFVAITKNTRDGVEYGPASAAIWGDSQDEVTNKARKRRAGARKRQIKNWADHPMNRNTEGGRQ